MMKSSSPHIFFQIETMVFRRPRVNVKPNVQTSRPAVSTAALAVPLPTESPVDQPVEPEPIVVEEAIPPAEPVDDSPIVSEETPPPVIAKPTPPVVRPVFRRKPVPNIAARPGAIHRR